MMDTDVLPDLLIVDSVQTAIIDAPARRIDIAGWLLNLPDAEYQRCAPPDHLAAGSTTTDDGRPMSINVEQIGGSLMIQHYIAEVHRADHCRMVSLSDLQTPTGWTKVQVIWDLSIAPLSDETCKYTNRVTSYPTRGFLNLLDTAGRTFGETAAGLQQATDDHNRRETRQYAASIRRKAVAQ
ncbi:MAG: hypothetical protein QOK02_2717 [Mycobacterium sp.]|jgi:hypothetical protein|nr:hypothetical protein [Mycobacterium sp.]